MRPDLVLYPDIAEFVALGLSSRIYDLCCMMTGSEELDDSVAGAVVR